ncbi:MAG: hypothetical protein MJK04_33680 [Psychrosphaera sp.]|nr:hypothetical protein [Psychrosphaera sp.]
MIETSKQFGQFREDGFVLVNKPVLPIDLVRKARLRIDKVMRGECDTGVSHWGTSNLGEDTQLQRIAQIHVCDKAINELVTQPIIGQIIAEHLGAKKVKEEWDYDYHSILDDQMYCPTLFDREGNSPI